jgi:PAS domain S-box-containing protein
VVQPFILLGGLNTGLVVALLSYLIFYSNNRVRHFALWTYGWGLTLLNAAVLTTAHIWPAQGAWLEVAAHCVLIGATYMLLTGCAEFRAKRFSRTWHWVAVGVGAWLLLSHLMGLPPLAVHTPATILTTWFALLTARVLWRDGHAWEFVPCNLAAASFVVWGVSHLGYLATSLVAGSGHVLYHTIVGACTLLCMAALFNAYIKYSACERQSLVLNYQALIEHAPTPAIITDSQHVLYANPASMELLGARSAGDITGRQVGSLFTIGSLALAPIPVDTNQQRAIQQELDEVVAVDGRKVPVQIISLIIQYTDRAARLLLISDVSSSANLAELARQAQAFAENLLQEASVMIIGLDGAGRIVVFNRVAEQISGYSAAELKGSDWFETLVPRERFTAVWQHFKYLCDQPVVRQTIWENPIVTKTGEERLILWQNSNIRHTHPVICTLSFGIDVTDLRREQRQGQQAQADLAAVFDEAHNAIMVLKERVIEMVNPAASLLFGYEAEEMLGQTTRVLYPSEDAYIEFGQEMYLEVAVRGSWRGELPLRHRDGSEVWSDVTLSPLPGSRVLVIMTDMTIYRESIKQLQRLATAVDSSFEGKVITDTEGIIQYINPAFEKIFGATRAEAIGKYIHAVIKAEDPDAPVYEELWQTLREGKPWTGQFTNLNAAGKPYIVESSVAPVRDGAGNLIAFVGSERDVTESIRLQRQYRQAMKMEAIGTLAGGIAHDFNNILFAIQGYSEMAQGDVDHNSRAFRNLEEVLHASRRATSLVKQILTFSRQQEQSFSPVSVDDIAREAIKFMRASLPAEVEIIASLGKDLAPVLADATQLYQVIINLCTNAGQAMRPQGGQLEVSVSQIFLAEEEAEQLQALKPGQYIMLSVKDTGAGIAAEIRERIFEPFFTTKEVGEGTGLGLAVVHGIITAAGGVITVDSELGQGTEFTVYLPCAESPEEQIEQEDQELLRGSGRILVVEDERRLAFMMKQQLERLGYEVTTLYRAERALWVLTQTAIQFDLIITDYSMPGMNGIEMLRQGIEAGVVGTALLVSGNVHDVELVDREKLHLHDVLLKPLSMRELAQAVKAACITCEAAANSSTLSR